MAKNLTNRSQPSRVICQGLISNSYTSKDEQQIRVMKDTREFASQVQQRLILIHNKIVFWLKFFLYKLKIFLDTLHF